MSADLITRHVHELQLDSSTYLSLVVNEYSNVPLSATLSVTQRTWNEGELSERTLSFQVTAEEARAIGRMFGRALQVSSVLHEAPLK